MRYHEYMLKGDEGGQEYVNDAGERFWVDTEGNATSLDTGYRFMCNFFADDSEALYGSVRPVFRDDSDLDLVEAVKGYTKYKDSEGAVYYVDAFGGVTDETGYVYTIGFYDADAARLFYDLVPVDDEYVEEDKDQVNHPSHYNEAGIESDGGPSSYYDFDPDWKTWNDFADYKSQAQWKEHSFHLGNVGKSICRWGDKGGTTKSYDARKIVYSGLRVLMMIEGKECVREYLEDLRENPQFSRDS